MHKYICCFIITLFLAGCSSHYKFNTPIEIKDQQLFENDEVKIKDIVKNINDNQMLSKRQHLKELNQQLVQSYSNGNYLKGIEFGEKVFQYAVKNFGEIDKDTLTSLNNLALLYKAQGRYSKAEPLYKRCLQLREKVLGYKHPSTLASINNLAALYRDQGRYSEAEPLYKNCLQLSEEVLGKKHPYTLTFINNLATLFYLQGKYPDAESFGKQCLQLREEVLGEKHSDTLSSINNLALLYQAQGRFSEAEPLYKRCLKLTEEVRGPKHPSTLTNINNLALLYQAQGRYFEAEPLYKHSLNLSEEVLGLKHPDTLQSINNLAALYNSQGRYPEAEPLFIKCLKLREKVLGTKHPHTIESINNLAYSYHVQGRYLEAEPIYIRSFQISKDTLGLKHPYTISCINNLASLYSTMGEYSKAEFFLINCLQLSEIVLGKNHPSTLSKINNLSILFKYQGRYPEAETLNKRCVELSKKILGPKHPDTLSSIHNLAALYERQGNYPEALLFYERCLHAREEVLGLIHPQTSATKLSYASCLAMVNKKKESLYYLKQLERSFLKYAVYTLQFTQKQSLRRKFMKSETNFIDALFTIAFQSNLPEIKDFASDVILRWKCIQEEAETTMNHIVHSSQDPNIVQLGKDINNLRRQMSILNKHVDLGALVQKLEQKELELAKLSKAFQFYLKKASSRMSDLEVSITSAVIELKQYRNTNFKKGLLEDLRLAAALIRPNSKSIILKDLGKMKDIILLFKTIQKAKSKKARKFASKKLYDRLFGAFDEHIKHASTIYISPDGLTHKIAFSRLILPDGRFWIERQCLCRIQTSRDLLVPVTTTNNGTLVAMGGIDYNQFPGIALKKKKKPDDYTYIRSMKRTSNIIKSFRSLQFSKIEVENIKMFYQLSQQKTPLIFRESSASEYQLKDLKTPPHILHLSTHGFYLESSEDVTERPMLLSGLALAGCNLGLKGKKGPDNEDGILYAIEVAGLNLTGTELVVLSACDTGKGTIDYSEGIYGLLRAFRLAGAQNIMMTLWSLQDKSASVFLTSFYKTWLSHSNMTPLKALRQTQLSFIKQNKDSKLWAPYVMVVGNVQ